METNGYTFYVGPDWRDSHTFEYRATDEDGNDIAKPSAKNLRNCRETRRDRILVVVN